MDEGVRLGTAQLPNGRQRLLRARELLETTDLTVDHVASHSGLGTGGSLRQHLSRHIDMTPAAYLSAFTHHPHLKTDR
ncbi:hypothetical protein STRCI_008468 [Streptomyces cinnabarinus]|uniref:HTH araC/xylS-type domain-containing protein n=1 Tax=Streptomyces cinnabarinus TaxID=67287 RepID=A0ABY7KQI3_9ACTN|nr:hypothetical protein [Streptomyces cinnabarinus]WAZ26821.1 hypothetical protein STRCI_008468 [Streptomyces cinnabarinus]